MVGSSLGTRTSLVALIVLILIAPAVALPDPSEPLPVVGCTLHATLDLPCGDVEVVWWHESIGVGWGEMTARSVLDAERSVLHSVYTVTGEDDGGNGCLAKATDIASGTVLWETYVPRTAGCSLVFDVVVDPVSGDVLIAGHDWTGGGDSAILRLDGASGAIVWNTDFPDGVVGALDLDAGSGSLFATNWTEGQSDDSFAGLIHVDLEDGSIKRTDALRPEGFASFWVLDLAVDPGQDLVLTSGVASQADANGGHFSTATMHATRVSDGAALWTAVDPNAGETVGAGLAYSAAVDRAFLASQSGIVTVDTQDGTIVGVAPLTGGTGWDDLVIYYDVVYDEATDTAVMTGSREPLGPTPGALVALAARGATGGLLWETLIATSDQEALAMAPAIGHDGAAWFVGSTLEGGQARGQVASVDLASGIILRTYEAAQSALDETALHYVAPVTADEVVVSGVVMRLGVMSGLDAHVRFA